jgi:hypothetical protein
LNCLWQLELAIRHGQVKLYTNKKSLTIK